jgi:ammonia channel protein AmtB
MFAMLFGVYGSLSVFFVRRILRRFVPWVDDRLDCFAVVSPCSAMIADFSISMLPILGSLYLQHGIGGIVGAGLTGLFADARYTGATNATGNPVNGAFFGNPNQLAVQCAGITVTIVFCIICTTCIYWFIWAFARIGGDGIAIVSRADSAYGLSLAATRTIQGSSSGWSVNPLNLRVSPGPGNPC